MKVLSILTMTKTCKWGVKGEKIMKTKSRDAAIMVSVLTDAEYQAAKQSNSSIKMHAHEFLEYVEGREGYWNRDTFMAQMERAVTIAEIKHPKDDGWRHVWVFDHSSCHVAMSDDALDTSHMSVKTWRKYCIMRDTMYDGKVKVMRKGERKWQKG